MEADVTRLAAFGAGLLSFISPGVLPLIPGYLAYLAGLTLDEGPGIAPAAATSTGTRPRVIAASLAFVLGFSLVFIALGATASAAGQFLMQRLPLFGRLAGAVILVSGLDTMGTLRVGWFSPQSRDPTRRTTAGVAGALVLGAAFALGWTPLIGPVLAGIFAVAASRDTVSEGVGLLATYAFGLAVPFVAAALVISSFSGAMAKSRPAHAAQRVLGALLVVMGLLILTNTFTVIALWLAAYLPAY
jgi:cytochrome c-type biogenesis protein